MELPEGSAGAVTLVLSGLSTIVAAGVAAWKRTNNKYDSESLQREKLRSQLDRDQRNFLDRILADNEKLRTEVALWEARARRIDSIAHAMRHQWNNERFQAGKLEVVPELPLLEDPIK